MVQDSSELEKLSQLIENTSLPPNEEGVELLAVAHNEFQARWSLSAEAIAKGRKMASGTEDGAHLVLRAFSLPSKPDPAAVSGVWHDFNIEGTDNSGYFTLPGTADAINASVGLVNKDGRFSPLVRGESVSLPAASPAVQGTAPEPETKVAPEGEEAPRTEVAEVERSTSNNILNEEEICAKLASLEGLPEEFREPAREALKEVEQTGDFEAIFSDVLEADCDELPGHSDHSGHSVKGSAAIHSVPKLESSGALDEHAVHDAVRAKLAQNPNPEIEQSEEKGSEQKPEVLEEFHAGASEQLASQWEEMWSEEAPIEIRAFFSLTGRIAPGMKLLLGQEVVKPAPGGFFSWKQEIQSFGQIWPMLQLALETPTVPAGPALEFFKDVEPAQRMLELHGSLEIEGHLTDPQYFDRLPKALQISENGDFKLSRMLPSGTIILPSISLIVA